MPVKARSARGSRARIAHDEQVLRTIAQNVYRLRTARGYSINQLATMTGDSFATIARLSDVDTSLPLRQNPRFTTVVRVAEALGTTVADLMRPSSKAR